MLDVRSFHFGMDEIKAHLHPLGARPPETLRAQQRLLAKWRANRSFIHDRVRMDPAEVSRQQLERIAILVDTVFATNPFYHQLYKSAGYTSGDIVTWNDYNALPAITKDDIINNYELFIGKEALAGLQYYRARTSGSSGRILEVLRDYGTADRYGMCRLRFYEQVLGRERQPTEWVYEIYLASSRFSSLDGQYPVFTLSQDCPPTATLEHLKLFRPAVLAAFPSYLMRMINLPGDFSKLGIIAICTNSEGSSKGERKRIAERFGAPVFDEYSSEELSLIATQCRQGQYHLVEDCVRADVRYPDTDGCAEIVATGLLSTNMPFIRYRQGDVIQLGSMDSICECGSRFRTLDQLLGRADQFLMKSDGIIVPPDRVMGLYDRTLVTPEARVSEFQLLQDEIDRVDLFVRLAPGADSPGHDVLEAFIAGLKGLFGDLSPEVCLHVVEEMPSMLSHKRRLITNRVHPSKER